MSRHLITSALPYINGVKHLGNLVGSMLPADVHARYLRAAGHDVLFICATDEHGTPAELAAREAGLDVAQFCAEQHEVQKDLCQRFQLSFDHFGRTSRPQNHRLTDHFARRLKAEGFTEVRTTEQVYSVADGRFLPDRYVVGTCPNCGYDRARGDQCENCGKQLEPTDLIEPRSAVSGSTDLEIRSSSHVFLLQSRLAERIRAWIDTKEDWPQLTRSIAYKWLDEGLEDRGITRDLDWGIPVDPDDFPEVAGKVWYVWFDAPIGYLGATREWADDRTTPEQAGALFDSWWRTDRGATDVTYTEFMGKDNVPFHTLSFPATILGSGEDWKLVDRLKSFNWLNYYGGKFSTTDHRGVFMSDALELLPADYWRWYLMANAPESDDTSFTWELFGEAINKDLVGTFGNFVNRTVTQVVRHFGEQVPEGGEPGDEEAELAARVEARLTEYVGHLDALEFRKAAAALRALWAEGNVYLENREPWKTVKVDRDRTACTLRTALGLVLVHSVASSPFVPATADRLRDAFPDVVEVPLCLDSGLGAAAAEVLRPGATLVPPPLLFRKLDAEELDAWEQRFGGAESAPTPVPEG
ncbi:methionine--tRNA ligase [Dermatobacter hominis]|uniref:methionine--tRNA ligase n=1 Tax=Dermatobacter hominis TaxID=2884263 RepID=UPI001D110AF1|nr:methionine--tRNA ligase [Dermatobacter hominis]UDY37022.1 methionine--tRNA ligase [Dermatobacter hominis]